MVFAPNLFTTLQNPQPIQSRPLLDKIQERFLQQLLDLPLDSINDQAEGEEKCKVIGQQIFDHYKSHIKNADYAFTLLEEIWDNLEGPRQKYVRTAWKGVGDSTHNWS